jgi:hypothetical protein
MDLALRRPLEPHFQAGALRALKSAPTRGADLCIFSVPPYADLVLSVGPSGHIIFLLSMALTRLRSAAPEPWDLRFE